MNSLFLSNNMHFLRRLFNQKTMNLIQKHKTDEGLEVEISLGCGNNWFNTQEKRLRYNSYCEKHFAEKFQYFLEAHLCLIKTSKNYTVYLSPAETKFSSYRKFDEKGSSKIQKKTVLLTRDDLIYNNRMRISEEHDITHIFQNFDASVFDSADPLYKTRDSYTWFSKESDTVPFCYFDITKTTKDSEWLYQIEIEFHVPSLFDNLYLKLDELYQTLQDFNTLNTKWLYMTKKIPLPTIQRPITLRREHIPKILTEYACTRKYDGIRCFLVFDNNDTYVMDVQGKIRIIDRGVLRQFNTQIVLDCEFITQDGNESCHIFDCIFDGVYETHLRGLKDRIQFCKSVCTEYENEHIDILTKRIETNNIVHSIQTLQTSSCNYKTDGLIFIPKDGSYHSTIDKVFKYKPIHLITIDLLVYLKDKNDLCQPHCKEDTNHKLAPFLSKFDISLFSKKNISNLLDTTNLHKDKVVVECKVEDNKIVPFKYRPDKSNPNKKSVIMDNLHVISQMKHSIANNDSEDCLNIWIDEFLSISQNQNDKLQTYLNSILVGKNILIYYGYECVHGMFDKHTFASYTWTVLNWKKSYHFNTLQNVSFIDYDAFPLESSKHDHILSIYTTCFQNNIQIEDHIRILEQRSKVSSNNDSTFIFLFSNTTPEYQNEFLSKLNNQMYLKISESRFSEWSIHLFKFSLSDVKTHDPPNLEQIKNTYNTRSNQIFKTLINQSKNENFFSSHPIKLSTQPIVP